MHCMKTLKVAGFAALLVTAIMAPWGRSDDASQPTAGKPAMQALGHAESGQIVVTDAGQPVLQYNYNTVEPPKGFLKKIGPGARKYAVPRSNYIHPLHGPDGEVLTEDWVTDHPHHRGVYWAWPEVDYGDQRGDLHALQRVFARPTGKIKLTDGPDFAQIEAENLWKWEDKTPIVREWTIIRAHRTGEHGRYIDLTVKMTALTDGVTLARRGTNKYGGLNIRLSSVKDLQLTHHADPPDAVPRRAWSDSVGIRAGGTKPVGFAVFEKTTNPDYPGDWIKYPNLPWFQPTFPAAGTRYALKKGQTLVLEYRLWIRRGSEASPEGYAARWETFNRQPSP